MLTILDRIKGDGAPKQITLEEMNLLKSEITTMKGDAEGGIWNRRRWAEDLRFCRWAGQTEDGRKHQAALDGKAAFPFEGASDARIRLADMIVNEHVMVKTAAAMRADLTVKGAETTDEAWASKIRTLLKYLTRGRQYRREIAKLAQYEEGDSPAAALLGVFWHKETGLKTREMPLEEFVEMAWQVSGGAEESGAQETPEGEPPSVFEYDPDFAADVQDLITNEEREEKALIILRIMLPVQPTRAKAMLKQWRAGGVASFPEPYEKDGTARIRAYKLYEDAFIPSSTQSVPAARAIFVREWLSAAQVQEKPLTEGWSESFVEQVVGNKNKGIAGQEGKSAFPEVYQRYMADGSTVTTQIYTEDQRKGLYEIIYAYWKAVNDDGVMGVYWTIIHGAIDESAIERQICPESEVHGEYPFVDFARESLNDRIIESRSVTELTMTDQNSLKLYHDTVGNHASWSIPAIFVPERQPNIKLNLGPLTQLRRRRKTDFEWMSLPDYPATAMEQQKETRRRVDEYFGRYNPEVDDRLILLKGQDRVDTFLASLADALVMIAQLAQANMTDAQLSRIVGGDGMQAPRTREEIQGQFDLYVDFDVRNLDPDFVLKMAEKMAKFIIPLDKRNTIESDKLVDTIMRAYNPALANAVLRPVAEADMSEVEDELLNFTKINAGIEPIMMKEGQNFELRYTTLLNQVMKNPESLEQMSPQSQEIFQARMDHLQFMVQQEENASIGQVGAKPALAPEVGE